MGWYTATATFTRKLGDAVIRHKRGDRIFIDFREESERLLREKAIVRGKVKLPPLPGAADPKDLSAEFKEVIRGLAKETGLPYEACHAKVKQYTRPDQKTGRVMPLEEAVLRIRNWMSLLDDGEKISLLAIDLGIADDEANEGISIVMEREQCSMDEAIAKIRSGKADMENPEDAPTFQPGEVVFYTDHKDGEEYMGRVESEIGHGLINIQTSDGSFEMNLSDVRKPREGEIVDGTEGNKDAAGATEDEAVLAEGVRVMAAYKGEVRTGVIVKICEGDEIRVKLDGDDADYRRLTREDVEVET